MRNPVNIPLGIHCFLEIFVDIGSILRVLVHNVGIYGGYPREKCDYEKVAQVYDKEYPQLGKWH